VKLYEVTCRGSKWQVEAPNASSVKHQVAVKFGMKKMPKGTVITKLGLVGKQKKPKVKTPPVRRAKLKPGVPVKLTDRQRKVMEEFNVSDTETKGGNLHGHGFQLSPNIPVERLSKSLKVTGCCCEWDGQVYYVSEDATIEVPAGALFRVLRKYS